MSLLFSILSHLNLSSLKNPFQVKAANGGGLQGINEEQQPACNGDQAQNWFGNSSGTLDALFHPPKSSGAHAAVNNNPNILGMDQPFDFTS